MNTENLRIATEFARTWPDTPPERLAPELISLRNETHRISDRSYLVIRNGRLVDQETGSPVRIDRSFYLGQKEGEFFDALENWADRNDEGTSFWISPSYESKYPTNKIVIYQIAYTFGSLEKALIHCTILFDTPKNHCLKIAREFQPQLKGLTNAEFLRNRLFVTSENFDIENLLEPVLNKEGLAVFDPNHEAIEYIVDLLKSRRDPYFVAQEMQKVGILGSHSISCPPSFGSLFEKPSLLIGEKLCCTCPFCKQQVEAIIFLGQIHCPKCKKSAPWNRT